MSWRTVEPSPFRGWIRWAPRQWPGARRPWLDLAGGRLAWPEEGAASPEAGAFEARPPSPVDAEVVYLPPVEPEHAAARDQLAAAIVEEGHAVAAQLFPEQGEPGGLAQVHLLDPTALLLDAAGGPGTPGLPRPPFAPRRSERTELVVLVPLLPGLLRADEELDELLEQAAALAPASLLPVTPELSPQDRRRLVERLGEDRFEAIFHGEPPREAALAGRAARLGLRCLPERPTVRALPPRAARNREVATALVEAGELWLRLGRREAEGVALLAAARRVEELGPDVSALAIEGNLALLDFLTPTGRRIVAEAAVGEPGLAGELRAEWAEGRP